MVQRRSLVALVVALAIMAALMPVSAGAQGGYLELNFTCSIATTTYGNCYAAESNSDEHGNQVGIAHGLFVYDGEGRVQAQSIAENGGSTAYSFASALSLFGSNADAEAVATESSGGSATAGAVAIALFGGDANVEVNNGIGFAIAFDGGYADVTNSSTTCSGSAFAFGPAGGC